MVIVRRRKYVKIHLYKNVYLLIKFVVFVPILSIYKSTGKIGEFSKYSYYNSLWDFTGYDKAFDKL
jgi:hypothetical protein